MKKFDVVGIGNVLLDFIIPVEDIILDQVGLVKGTMNLIDENTALKLLDSLKGKHSLIAPGGSSANTIAGVSALGGVSAFIGTIGADENGQLYTSQTIEDGVAPYFFTHETLRTGFAITLVTPDGERSFVVFLGASQSINLDAQAEDVIAKSKYLHLEGYQLEMESGRELIRNAMKIAKEHDTTISIDFSDVGVIERNKVIVTDILKNYADIVFVNEHEAKALTGHEPEIAIQTIAQNNNIAVVKIGEKGSLIKSADALHQVPSYVADLVNTNGAGDMYAGGILFGLTHGYSLEQAGHIASFSASQVVGQAEARLSTVSQKKVLDFIKKIPADA